MSELLAALPGPLPLKLAFLILPMLPNLLGIWHVYRHRFLGQEQIIWLMVCVFVPVIGGIAYFFFGRPRTNRAAKLQKDAQNIAEF